MQMCAIGDLHHFEFPYRLIAHAVRCGVREANTLFAAAVGVLVSRFVEVDSLDLERSDCAVGVRDIPQEF
jgi:hypothetical protein